MENQRLQAREKKLIHILFLCFGFGIMAWIPRFPEVKSNLGLERHRCRALRCQVRPALVSGSLAAGLCRSPNFGCESPLRRKRDLWLLELVGWQQVATPANRLFSAQRLDFRHRGRSPKITNLALLCCAKACLKQGLNHGSGL